MIYSNINDLDRIFMFLTKLSMQFSKFTTALVYNETLMRKFLVTALLRSIDIRMVDKGV